MNDKIELQKRAREFVRWILRMLYAIRPGGVGETIVLRVLQDLDFDCELNAVRQETNYLRSLGLAEARTPRQEGSRVRCGSRGI